MLRTKEGVGEDGENASLRLVSFSSFREVRYGRVVNLPAYGWFLFRFLSEKIVALFARAQKKW